MSTPSETDFAADVEGTQSPEPGGWDGYPLDELSIRDERRTAQHVAQRMKDGRFVMDPDFQRGFVWDPKKQSRLIESILLRIPLPVFYVAEDSKGRLIVVDGRQRLTTISHFLADELTLDLPDRPELHRKKFSDLDPRLQDRVEDCQLLFYIIDHKVPERARLDIFERVNGGERLTRQQMRNAIYNGPATAFLRDEAEAAQFVLATGGSLNPLAMQDREFVNRFCSFTLLPLGEYKGDMDDWLARSLQVLNRQPLEIERVRGLLRCAIENNLAVFGEHAFRKHRPGATRRSLVNAALFDVMSTGLARIDPQVALSRADALRDAFHARMDDERFLKAITWGPNTPREVQTRFDMARAMFDEVFNAA